AFETDLADAGEIFFRADVHGVAHGVNSCSRGGKRGKALHRDIGISARAMATYALRSAHGTGNRCVRATAIGTQPKNVSATTIATEKSRAL
ncbi:hypothetical protein KWH37_20595, partial [Xanthomonas campestris pv. carissae]|nr:hypothetical protein [Xanthomonas campestris pv. carissae]